VKCDLKIIIFGFQKKIIIFVIRIYNNQELLKKISASIKIVDICYATVKAYVSDLT